jgi:hypothetical protein
MKPGALVKAIIEVNGIGRRTICCAAVIFGIYFDCLARP